MGRAILRGAGIATRISANFTRQGARSNPHRRRHHDHQGGTVSSPQDSKSQLHVPRLVLSRQVHEQVHGSGAIGRFNTYLAVKITKTVGTMWIAYLFAAIALISLPAALRTGDVIIIVAWIAQTFFHLFMLPIILAGQNATQPANDAR